MSEWMSPICLIEIFIVNIFNILFYPMKRIIQGGWKCFRPNQNWKTLLHVVLGCWKKMVPIASFWGPRHRMQYGGSLLISLCLLSNLRIKGHSYLSNHVGKGEKRILTTSRNTSQVWNTPTCSCWKNCKSAFRLCPNCELWIVLAMSGQRVTWGYRKID